MVNWEECEWKKGSIIYQDKRKILENKEYLLINYIKYDWEWKNGSIIYQRKMEATKKQKVLYGKLWWLRMEERVN